MAQHRDRHRAAERLADIEELEVDVEKLVSGGDGLARFEGIPIFVPRSAAGDRLRIRLVERHPGFARAEIAEILTAGPGRIAPRCPHYERCGGCNLQHLGYELQLRSKVEAVRETLLRLGGIEMPPKVSVIPGQPWGYRLRTQLHVAGTERGTEVGYFAHGSRDLVPVDSCPILVPELESVLPALPRRLRQVHHRRIDLAAGDDGLWTASPPVERLSQGEVSARIGDFVYHYDAGAFFQAHRQLLPTLVERALDVAGDAQDADGCAYDLFAGVGLFSLPLSRRYGRVVAIEGERAATRLARRNARRNQVTNLELEAQSVETWIAKLPPRPARVVVDPPRVGLSSRVRVALVDRRPRRLTYVSCHDATLARDLKYLRRVFDVESLTLLDMFPQTGHIELVAQLVAKDDA